MPLPLPARPAAKYASAQDAKAAYYVVSTVLAYAACLYLPVWTFPLHGLVIVRCVRRGGASAPGSGWEAVCRARAPPARRARPPAARVVGA
jgi:hypothetical protein